MFRLFLHEALRVFHDRLISSDDKQYFYEMLCDVAGHCLRLKVNILRSYSLLCY